LRDKGICAKCGKDVFSGTGRMPRARGTGDLWQADHIESVVEGGGTCGLDNYQTLCTACHKAKTAELAAKRAWDRKQKVQQLLPFDVPVRVSVRREGAR
jgi:5-methylcytosine-specific restriction endonuclease McrA